jgi:LmbE family N-acetylglucosaminyl deacetylase
MGIGPGARDTDAAQLRNAAVVAAHPDDEIIWFSSIVAQVGRIVICYGPVAHLPERGLQRRRAIAGYPLPTVEFLDLPEPGPQAASGAAEVVHRRELVDALRVCLHGVDTVFTHNPWGEYGHLDHCRVNTVVNEMRRDLGYATYVSAYMAERLRDDAAVALTCGVRRILTFPTDQCAIDAIYNHYRSHGCWTWFSDWNWPPEERFLSLGGGKPPAPGALPVQAFPFAP